MKKTAKDIASLKKKHNAVILAHNYQRPEIQDIADFVGDSLALSKAASETKAHVIVFCGVDFMAETAAILNPHKKVIIPDRSSICPMAQMLSVEDLKSAQRHYPGSETVLYINSTAETKAEANCICTSANAVEVVNAMKADTILFGPDKNLAYYVSKRTDKRIIPVPDYGVCPTHHSMSLEDVLRAKKKRPKAEVIAHPETIPEVQEVADHISSTSGMIAHCKASRKKEFIIATEIGMLYRLKKDVPGKRFIGIDCAICPPMKMMTLEKLQASLENLSPEVIVPRPTAYRARQAIDCMLNIPV